MTTSTPNSDRREWRIVVIDDNPDDRAEVRRLLLRGFDGRVVVVEASTVEAGTRAALEGEPPDCVLLDHHLPDMEAPEALAALAGPDGTQRRPVVVLTGETSRDRAKAVLRAGAQDYLNKAGMTEEGLVRAVENAVERWGLVRELRDRSVAQNAADERLRFALEAAYMVSFEWDVVKDEVRRHYSGSTALPATPAARPDRFEDVARVVHPEDRDVFRSAVRRALESPPEGRYEAEFRIVGPAGDVRWLFERGRVEFDAAGRPLRLTGLSQDATSRKAAEEARRETESVLHSFYESSPLLMGVVELIDDDDSDIRHVYDSPATDRFFGHEIGSTAGKTARELGVPAEAVALWVRHYRRAARTGEAVRFEYEHSSVAGRLWFSVVVAPIGRPDAPGRTRFSYTVEDVTTRRRNEESLRDRHRFISELTSVVPGVVYLFDVEERRNVYVNRRTELALGYTEAEIAELGSGFLPGVIHPQDAPRLERHVAGLDARSGGAGAEIEYRMRHRDGTWRWFLSRDVVYRRGEDGRVRQVLGVATDIHARKEAEERLLENRERLASALEAAEVGTWRVDYTTGQDTRDANLDRLLGLPVSETTRADADYFGRVHPLDRPLCLAAWDRAKAGIDGGLYDMVNRVVLPDGRVRWVRDRGRFAFDNGTPRYAVGALVDITERKSAEEAVRASERRFRRAADASGTLVYDLDLDAGGRLEVHGVEHIVGDLGRVDELSSGWWHSRIHPEDLPGHISHFAECLGDPTCETYRATYRVQHADDSWRHVEDTARIMRGHGGVASRLVGAIRDVTDRVRVEEDLKEADRRKNQFLAILAHELRNPLSAIRSALTILRMKGPDTPDLVWGRDVIDRQSAQLQRLIDDLLDVSRINSGKVRLKLQSMDLRDAAHQAAEAARTLIDAKRHRLSIVLPNEPLPVLADPARIDQVFGNLLTNAAKYMDEGGSISLRLERDDGEAVVRVRDEGVGIPPEQLPRIFEMFTQVDGSLDRAQGGLGIGLNLVKSLTEMHGGDVAAFSGGLGAGSEFVLRLPLSDRAAGVRAGGPLPPAAAPVEAARTRRILVVDDNVDTAVGTAELLRQEGHQVDAAHDGVAALALARSRRPDVVLLDIGLPGMDGYQVARELRDDPKTSRAVLVAISGYGRESDRALSRDAGFDHHLIKPLDLDRLRSLIEDHIDRRGGG